MSSRARMFAAVTLLISCLAGIPAWAQVQNLEAGKSASQLFAGTCNACHKSPRGLLKTVSPGSLAGFLREHYTTSGDMASQLASYLNSNGASDSRQAKPGADKLGADKQGSPDQPDRQGRKNRTAPPQEAARPEDAPPVGESARQARKRLGRTGEPSDETKPVANAPASTAVDGPDGRKLSPKQRGRLNKPIPDEPAVANTPPKVEPATDDKPKADSNAASGNIGAKPDITSKPASEAKSEPAKLEPPKPEAAKTEAPKDAATSDKPMARREPVPAVTPADSAASAPAPVSAPAAASSSTSREPAAPKSPPSAAPVSPAVTASAPPPPPAEAPPAPPISR
jgi:hypothetical protein